MRNLVIASLMLLGPLLLDELQKDVSFGSQAVAADEEREKRRVPPLKERTYKILSEAQMLIDPDSIPLEEGEERPDIQPDPRAAIELLMKGLTRRGLNAYEVAQIWNTLAFAYYTLDDIDNTIRAYEEVLKQPQIQISLAIELSATRALFQLYYSREDYRKAITYIDRWEALNITPDAGIVFIKSTAYYQLEEYRNSLEEALRVEEIVIAQGREMKENWLYIQVVLYNELEDLDNVINVLERLIVLFPKKQYWMHLAGMYAEKEWPEKTLGAYYAAYLQGMFGKETEIVMLAQRLLNAEVPFEAASILEKGFSDELVKKNERNMRLLAACYTMSQEFELAIEAWRDATEFAEDGLIYYRLAQALANEDRHKEAVKAYRNALDKGDLKSPEEVNFWMGISLMQVQEWSAATKAFRVSSKDKKKAKSSRQYIRYIQSEKRRLAALREMATGN